MVINHKLNPKCKTPETLNPSNRKQEAPVASPKRMQSIGGVGPDLA